RNQRGVEMVNALRLRGIEPIELISSTSETRAAAGALSYLLSYLAEPQSASKLARAYQVWRRDVFGSNKVVGTEQRSTQDGEEDQGKDEQRPYISQIPSLLRKMVDVENFIAPQNANDWLATIGDAQREAQQVIQELSVFRVNVQRWLNAV